MTAFNFTVFKAVMDVAEADEISYGFILKSVFAYLKRAHDIDLNELLTLTVSGAATTSSIPVVYDKNLLVGQEIRVGAEVSYITKIVNNDDLTLSTITVSPALSIAPIDTTTFIAIRFITSEDLQYAVFQHVKYLFERQKKNAFIVESTTDAQGNKATYTTKPPHDVFLTYCCHSPNPPAFI